MSSPSRAHRASAQRRREALLDAAAELAAEVGAGAVTHRAVAARAGVPLSTTSYFFSSIDELVSEALRRGVQGRVADFDAAERAWVLGEGPIDAVIEDVIDQVLASSVTAEGSQVEYYLAAGRDAELRPHASATVTRFAERTSWQLERLGARGPDDAAWALQAWGDGAMLHRLAGVETDHRERLRAGMRALLAAAMLSEAETDDLLARYDRTPGGELTDTDPPPSDEVVGA